LGLLGVHTVDGVEADERVELLAPLPLARLAHRAGDHVALAQGVLADLGERDVDVVGSGQVAGGAHERVVVEDVEDARDGDEDILVSDHGLRLAVAVTPAAAIAAVPSPAPAAAATAVTATAVVVVTVLAPAL